MQERLLSITDDVPANAFFAVTAKSLADGLCDQIKDFISEHSDTVLVVADTFQMVRSSDADPSYTSDYAEIQELKQLTDELSISVLLVHHLRKQGDSDPLNKLSGTIGISGAVDAVFVLDRSRRSTSDATLICIGRDIEYREMELRFQKESCSWELIADSAQAPELLLPSELSLLVSFMREEKSFAGSNSEFAKRFCEQSGCDISTRALKQMMNRWRYALEDAGISFESYRSNGQRLLKIEYGVPAEAQRSGSGGERTSDGTDKVCRICGEARECSPRGRGDASD